MHQSLNLSRIDARDEVEASAAESAKFCPSRRCCVLDLLRYLIIGMGHFLLVHAIFLLDQADPPSSSTSAPKGQVQRPIDATPPFYYIILNSPLDLNALLQKIQHPDLEVMRVDRPAPDGVRDGARENRITPPPWLVESVRIAGQIEENFATLKVDLGIVLGSADPTWVPIRLDNQRLTVAREGARELSLRMGERTRWQVELAGRGEHHIQVELRVPVTETPARKAIALGIPEAASTSLELDFVHRESDIIIGSNENFGLKELADGKVTRLSAHLSPRSNLEVSWTNSAGSGALDPPLLTAQGEIAIDIDSEQMRTRSSWAIRCVRGMTRSLEIRIDDQDEVTELRLDDQPAETGIVGERGAGKLTVRLADPLRPGSVKRLLMKTRRSYPRADHRRIPFGGFPLTNAREQSGSIGITQSSNLWVSPATSQGLRRIGPWELPKELRERPSTSLAFEFPDHPFLLHLDVEVSPPLVRARSTTLFRIEPEHARSETTIELQWVRERLFEVELGVGPSLQVVSIGPPDVVESTDLTGAIGAQDRAATDRPARRLKLRLAPKVVRDQKKVTLKLQGLQRIPPDGSVRLGLFTPDETTSVSASYALIADRSLSLGLEDDSGQVTRSGDLKFPVHGPSPDWPYALLVGETSSPPLLLANDGNSPSLPIRITRHPRALAHQTVLSVQVSRQALDLLQRTTFTVRFGTLSSVEIRVPAAISDRWELIGRQGVEREDLGQDPDGVKRYRLIFDQPVLDKVTLRIRSHLPMVPPLDAASSREVAVPCIVFEGRAEEPARVDLSLAPEIVFEGTDPAWIRSSGDAEAQVAGTVPAIAFTEGTGKRGRPFRFTLRALEPISLPALVVPRLLITTVLGSDEPTRSRARYWVESHGPIFPFALPDGARWIAARIDGRVADQLDYDPSRSSYRLRFPSDVGVKPALVELEYQVDGSDPGSTWQPPQLLGGGVVLQTLWEVRLPWSTALIGVPRGWFDENEWYWDGDLWKSRPSKTVTSLNEWLLGSTPSTVASDDHPENSLYESPRFLFSRSGEPHVLSVWLAPRAWIVATCSGATLIVGFFAIFSQIRFRTIWIIVAGLALLTAMLLQPSVTFLAVQSGFIGVALTLLGLVIQRLIERSKARTISGREAGPQAGATASDSGLGRSPSIGSDDSTAIRVRVASTMDFVASPASTSEVKDEARSSTLERA
jgi:hypothetical protein